LFVNLFAKVCMAPALKESDICSTTLVYNTHYCDRLCHLFEWRLSAAVVMHSPKTEEQYVLAIAAEQTFQHEMGHTCTLIVSAREPCDGSRLA
jgi:hypothetical protein